MNVFPEMFGVNPLRVIANCQNEIFLTFDDGPDPATTPRLLDILSSHQAKATFFLVAQKARENPEIVRRILSDGHAIGNHSLDHRFGVFWGGRNVMLEWIDSAQKILADIGVSDPVGFRPPAGIVTPELVWALKLRELPLILWSNRFFDTVFEWTESRALQSAQSESPGAIILLHDRTGVSWLEHSGSALEVYLATAKRRRLRFHALTRDLCEVEINP